MPDVVFRDEAFGEVRGSRAGDMWRMLTRRAPDLEITFRDVAADDEGGTAHWEARYAFSGRSVWNVVDARFRFRDGKIVGHIDRFDFWRWSHQALGPVGLLLGWSSLLKRAVRKQANEGLDAFIQKG